MSIKKRPSASDVLRQEMQQPLVIPAAPTANNVPQPTPTPPTPTTMNQPTNDAAANEAKLKQQIEDLQSKLQAQTTKTDGLTKELKEAKDTVVKLAAQGSKAPAKSTAIAKTDATTSRSGLTARPVQTSEETAIRRANTDIGWLD